ncbi:MAG: Adenylate cyclase [Candidatus Rifleibacterium amylolyticum]|nr:MAG: Adenylate cyclase [Candidatus Rifleibacterium amylolyticum]
MEETRVLTIVFTDIKGFTERTSHSDREAVSRLLQKHEELLLPLAKNYDGVLVKTIGDAFLLTFASPTNAVLCAIMMQEKLKEFNASVSDAEKIEIRIAMNTGEVILRDGDVYGEPVNVAARIEALTDANEIWFSESTYLAMNRQEVPTSLIGEYRLKGIPEAVRVYRVVRDENSEFYAKTVQNQLAKIRDMLAETVLPTAKPRSAIPLYFVGFAILLALAYFIFRESDHDRHLRLAREAFSARDYRGTIESLKKAAQIQPADNQMTDLLKQAVNSHITQRLTIVEKTAENLAELDQFVKETRAAFSTLDNSLIDCEIELALAQADLLARQRSRDEADNLLTNLAKRSNNRSDVLFAIARFYSNKGYNWTHTMRYMHQAALTDPASFAANPEVLSEFAWFLDKVAPDDGYTEIRDFIGQHCFDHFAEKLTGALYHPGEDFHVLRRNARYLLQKRGETIDETRFYLVDLMTSPGSRNSKEQAETLDYFVKNAENKKVLDEIAAQIASHPSEFKLFESYSYDRGDPETLLVAGPFFAHFKNYLRSRLNADSISQRLNAYNVLISRNEVSDDESWQYHIRNLIDFKGMRWSQAYAPALYESVDSLLNKPLPPNWQGNADLVVVGRKAALAARELTAQIQQAIEKGEENPFTAQGNRNLNDFKDFAARLAKAFQLK